MVGAKTSSSTVVLVSTNNRQDFQDITCKVSQGTVLLNLRVSLELHEMCWPDVHVGSGSTLSCVTASFL